MRQMKVGGRVNPGNRWDSPTHYPSKRQGLNKDPMAGKQRKGFRNTPQKPGSNDSIKSNNGIVKAGEDK
jgi:hypothetical protein